MKRKRLRKKFSYYAKILIVSSLALLIYGLILDIHNDIRLFDPEEDVVVVSGGNGEYTSIDNNSSDDSDVIKENIDNNTKNETDEKNNSGSNDASSSSNNSGAKGSVKRSNNTQNNANTNANVVQDENNNLRVSIQNTYGIAVKYGSETDGYSVGGLSTTSITDKNTIKASLEQLDYTLSLYPSGMFREIKNGGIPLTVYLINSYSEDGVTGATDSNFSFANISIAVSYPFDESFFHESYHYMERYILKKSLSYNSIVWSSYNPNGFNYGNIYNGYSYKSTFAANSYFVNNYAQVSAEEDRASTFEYMMAPTKASCLNNDMPVWRKAKLMSEMIDAALGTVSPSVVEYWERYL